MPRKSEEARIAAIQERIQQLRAQEKQLISRESKKAKADFKRTCMIIGEVIQKHGDIETIRSLLEEHVKDDKDRARLGLKPAVTSIETDPAQDPEEKIF